MKGPVNGAALHGGERLTSIDCVGHLPQLGGQPGLLLLFQRYGYSTRQGHTA